MYESCMRGRLRWHSFGRRWDRAVRGNRCGRHVVRVDRRIWGVRVVRARGDAHEVKQSGARCEARRRASGAGGLLLTSARPWHAEEGALEMRLGSLAREEQVCAQQMHARREKALFHRAGNNSAKSAGTNQCRITIPAHVRWLLTAFFRSERETSMSAEVTYSKPGVDLPCRFPTATQHAVSSAQRGAQLCGLCSVTAYKSCVLASI